MMPACMSVKPNHSERTHTRIQTGLMYNGRAQCLLRPNTQMQCSLFAMYHNDGYAYMCLGCCCFFSSSFSWLSVPSAANNAVCVCAVRKVAKTRKTPQTMNDLEWLVEQRQRWTRMVVVTGNQVKSTTKLVVDFGRQHHIHNKHT